MVQLNNVEPQNHMSVNGEAKSTSAPEFRALPAQTASDSSLESLSMSRIESSMAAYPPPTSNRENHILNTYLHQIGKIQRLKPEDERNLFIKIDKHQKRVDECYQELAKHHPNIDLEDRPTVGILRIRITASSSPVLDIQFLLHLVEQIETLQGELEAAKNEIITANLRLCVCVAKKFQQRGLELLDLIQEANLGLLNAIEHYDWQRGVRFGAYASWWIQQAIGCGIVNQGQTIRIPAHVVDAIRKVNRAKADLRQRGNHEPSLEELAETTRFPIEKVMQLDTLSTDTISLGTCISEETGGTIEEFIPCPQTSNPLTEVIQQNLSEAVNQAIDELPWREQQIVSLRYGLADGEERSLQEVGAILNLSRERIRQLETRALERLRHPARCEKLHDFLMTA